MPRRRSGRPTPQQRVAATVAIGALVALATIAPPTAASAQSKRMFVYGDSLATNVYTGLKGAAPKAGIARVQRRTRGATGLVRDDQYNWFTRLERYLAKDRPDIVVVALGGNDRQDMRTRGATLQRFSAPWWRAYRARVRRAMSILSKSGAEAYWVGLPIVRSGRMTGDYAKFNRIYREIASQTDVAYVDVWDRFSVGGRYARFGPSVSGRRVALRHADGIHFSGAGSAVLAEAVLKTMRARRAQRTASGL